VVHGTPEHTPKGDFDSGDGNIFNFKDQATEAETEEIASSEHHLELALRGGTGMLDVPVTHWR